MTTALAKLTFLDLVAQEVPELPADARGAVLWEHTGFPAFWSGDAETCCREQLRAFRARWLTNGRQYWDPIAEALARLEAGDAP